MSTPKLVVKPHDPRRALLRVALGVVVVAAAVVVAYGYGHHRGGTDYAATRDALTQLQAELGRQESQVLDLRRRLAGAERSGQVDGRAHTELRGLLAAQNDEILTLREELEFYRGIVSPSDSRRGLRVHDFRVLPVGEERVYRFRLVLIQAMQHDRQAQGRALVTVVGRRDGVQERRPLSSLGDHAEDGIPYDFRYFQEFDGDILLPDGFVPDRVEIELIARAARDGRVDQAFDWVEE